MSQGSTLKNVVVTDANGVDTAAVKPANTPATAADPALVVAISPGTELETGTIYSGYQPAPINNVPVGKASSSYDASGRLETHGTVLTDETSFRDDFPGAALTTALTGTTAFVNGSNELVGTGTSYSTEVTVGSYLKKTADANTLYVLVEAVNSDTSVTLATNYAGATGSSTVVQSNWFPTIGAGGAITVATSNVTLATGTTASSLTSLVRSGDYCPMTARILGAIISQRIANQDIRFGFQSDGTRTPQQCACFIFTGTVNGTVLCRSSSSVSGNDTQNTTVAIPNNSGTGSAHEYKVDVSTTQVTFSIDNVVVAKHQLHIPGPYDRLDYVILVANDAAAPASSTNLIVDGWFTNNMTRVQVDDDFSGEPLPVVSVDNTSGAPTIFTAFPQQTPFVPCAGKSTAVVKVFGAFVGSIAINASVPDGNFQTIPIYTLSGVQISRITGPGTYLVNVAGFVGVSAQVFSYVSGAPSVTINVSDGVMPALAGANPSTYFAALQSFASGAVNTDVFVLAGSASRAVRISRIRFSMSVTTAVQFGLQLIKRSTANTGGTSALVTPAPYDSVDAAATATARSYTANAATLGTVVGTAVRSDRYLAQLVTVVPEIIDWDFGLLNAKQPVLRGVAESLAINFGGAAIAGGIVSAEFEWTEEES